MRRLRLDETTEIWWDEWISENFLFIPKGEFKVKLYCVKNVEVDGYCRDTNTISSVSRMPILIWVVCTYITQREQVCEQARWRTDRLLSLDSCIPTPLLWPRALTSNALISNTWKLYSRVILSLVDVWILPSCILYNMDITRMFLFVISNPRYYYPVKEPAIFIKMQDMLMPIDKVFGVMRVLIKASDNLYFPYYPNDLLHRRKCCTNANYDGYLE